MINCRSVCNKAITVKDYITDHNLDLILLTETWLGYERDRQVCGDLLPSGYEIKHISRKKRRGGGVALVYRSTISLTDMADETTSSFEGLSVCMTSESSPVRILVLYRLIPSRVNTVSASSFQHDFQNIIDRFMLKSGKLLIAGDFNIHWDVEKDPERKRLLDILQSSNLTQHVMESTHQDGHTIDLVITRSNDDLVTETSVQALISDHFAVHFNLNIHKPPIPRKETSFRKHSAVDHSDFEQDLQKCELVVSPSSTLDGLVDQYDHQLGSLMDKHQDENSGNKT